MTFNAKEILKSRQWSKYQLDIFQEAKEGNKNILVNAVAGSGKTTSIVGIVASVPANWKVKVVAFNNHIVDELKKKLPTRVTVSTAHKTGLGMIIKWLGRAVAPDSYKYKNIIKNILNEDSRFDKFAKYQLRKIATTVEDLVHFVQVTLDEDIKQISKRFGIDTNKLEWDVLESLVSQTLATGIEQAFEGVIGMDDMLYLPSALDLEQNGKCDLLLVDEAQDANNAQIELYRRIQAKKTIFMGDSKQAIYGFAGSNSEAWETIKEIFDPIELPLSICYRCPASHIKLAKEIVPQIEARENAPEGVIDDISYSLALEKVEPKDLIISRVTAPLVSMCLDLILRQKRAKVRGRDIGKMLVGLAKNFGEKHQFLDNMSEYFEEKSKDLEGTELESLRDKIYTLEECFKRMSFRTMNEFYSLLENLFQENAEETIILSTVHRSKGDEADRVFILKGDKMPLIYDQQQEWELEQEYNLKYVALTRAKKELYFITDFQVF